MDAARDDRQQADWAFACPIFKESGVGESQPNFSK